LLAWFGVARFDALSLLHVQVEASASGGLGTEAARRSGHANETKFTNARSLAESGPAKRTHIQRAV